ncbi:MAG: major coat protein [Pseudomonadota bacterium]
MQKYQMALSVFLLSLMTEVMAALPASVATAYTTAESDFGDLMDLFWPVLIVVSIAFVIIKFYKRTTAKL